MLGWIGICEERAGRHVGQSKQDKDQLQLPTFLVIDIECILESMQHGAQSIGF